MNVLIIGANGTNWPTSCQKATRIKQHNPIAMIRKEEQSKKFEEQGVKTALSVI